MSLIQALPEDQKYLVTKTGNSLYKSFKVLMAEHDIHMTFHDLRHINASVMAVLQIPDKYAMERGGWASDHVMKNVYTHTFSKERVQVDNVIDSYFENVVGEKAVPVAYPRWLEFLHLHDSEDCRKLYAVYEMQHEMQHENN